MLFGLFGWRRAAALLSYQRPRVTQQVSAAIQLRSPGDICWKVRCPVPLVESQTGLDSAEGSATSYLVLASPGAIHRLKPQQTNQTPHSPTAPPPHRPTSPPPHSPTSPPPQTPSEERRGQLVKRDFSSSVYFAFVRSGRSDLNNAAAHARKSQWIKIL